MTNYFREICEKRHIHRENRVVKKLSASGCTVENIQKNEKKLSRAQKKVYGQHKKKQKKL